MKFLYVNVQIPIDNSLCIKETFIAIVSLRNAFVADFKTRELH